MSFGALQETDFVGRREELDSLSRKVFLADKGLGQSVVLSGPPGIGKTELLKQLFSRLFWKQDHVVPFYYSVNHALLSAAAFSRDYLTRYLCQRLAFEKKEQFFFYLEGISIDGLSVLIEEREAVWARDILDRFLRSSDNPVEALKVAISAPHRSALATGMPVAVLIDEFQRLQDLHDNNIPDPRLVSLFEAPLSFSKTLHVITGNAAEIHEMPVTSGLERIAVHPLRPEDATAKAHSLLRAYNEPESDLPPLLMRRLGGNPLYLERVVAAACAGKKPGEQDFLKAYAREIVDGALGLSWSSALKRFFPDLGLRKTALEMAYKIRHSSEPLSIQRLSKAFALTEAQSESIVHALYLAGLARGEFGVLRAPEDEVAQDSIDCLYMREILGKSSYDLEREILEKSLPEKEHIVRFELALPMAKEAELVAAQCLDQIGKNLHISQDAIGQLQIAVIEACINALEHGKGAGGNIQVSFVVAEDHVEASIESSGREFIVPETGEPFMGGESAKAPGRGWGIKLMKRFADEVRFEKTARGTKTVLVKKIAKFTGVQKEDTEGRE